MAVRKTRTGRLARAAQGERHSVRSSPVKSPRTNPTRTGRQRVTQESLNQPDELLLPRITSWSETLAAVEKQSLGTQIHKYKEWRRNGSAHEDYCRWLRDSRDSLFCPICVRRGWHTTPPPLTPPGSPPPAKQEDSAYAATPATSVLDPGTNPSSNTLSHIGTSGRPSGVSPVQQARTGDRQDISAGDSTAPKTLYNLLGNDDEATDDIGTPQRPRRQRKSRYTNLPTEVDTALSVLYRELESNESLRREVEELRSENTKYNQTIRIRDLSIIALRRELDYRRSSEQEMETLRATATQLENAKKEIQELRARNEALNAELQTSRHETTEAQALVRDWKAKLSQLIGN
ncbi:hypothetical protein AnigIFM62618_006068 [Aspergillus niger]|nr:hypothetical protein AnigIFM62618_006068 [Aspergillus niger]